MISYWATLSARFRTLLQYRAAALAGMGTQLFWGLVRVMIFEAFFRSTIAEQPMSAADVITYIWLAQAFFSLIPTNVDPDTRAQVRSGSVGYDLLRPLDLYAYWYTRSLALRIALPLLRAPLMIAFALLLMGMDLPASWASAAAFALSMAAAVLLSAAFTTLLNITLMWTISGDGVTALAPGFVMIMSGMIVPLPLYPDWAQPVLDMLPFRGLIDTPFRLYLGHIPASELPLQLAHQLAWTVAIVLLGRWILSRGVRRLVIQGG